MSEDDDLDDAQRRLVAAMLKAASSVANEFPYIGRQRAHERALSGRLGIWLSRQPFVRRLERQGIRVDIEYDQMADGDPKVVGDRRRRIDVLLHRRGPDGPNLLACEVKPNDGKPGRVDADDLDKLRHLTGRDGPFRYVVGMWLSLPRSSQGSVYYAVVAGGELLGEDRFNGIRQVSLHRPGL